MPLAITSKARPGSPTTQSRLIPADHIQVNPDLFPHQTRPITEVAEWCNVEAARVHLEMSWFVRNVKRWLFLVDALEANPEANGAEAAQQRRDQYAQEARRVASGFIEGEYKATLAWELLSLPQRVEHGCTEVWEADPELPDLYGQTWRMSPAQAIPQAFTLPALFGAQPAYLDQGLRLFGRAEYVRRGLLQGQQDLTKPRAAADRRSAIASRTKDRLYGEKASNE